MSATAPPSRTRLILTVAAIALAPELMPLSLTLLYPAIHSLASTFHTTDISWAVSIGLLVGGASLPLSGKIADIVGKRTVMLLAVGTFAVGTAVALAATNFPMFLLGRGLQGCVAAAIPAAYGLARDVLPPRVVPIAVGVISTGFGLSTILGPLLSGVLVDSFGYRGVFVFELVYVLPLLAVLLFLAPESPVRAPQRLDVGGTLLLTATAAALMLVVSKGSEWGWTATSTLGCAVAVPVCLGAFLVVENRVAQPLIALRLLGSAKVTMTLAGAACGAFGLAAYGYLMPQLLQTPQEVGYGFGLSALGVALYTLPQGVCGMATGPVGGLIARRWSARYALLGGTGMLAVSLLLLAFFNAATWQVLLLAGVEGIGFGLFYAGPPNLIIEAVPDTMTGISAGITNTVQQISSAIGTAAVGGILAHHVASVSSESRRRLHHGRVSDRTAPPRRRCAGRGRGGVGDGLRPDPRREPGTVGGDDRSGTVTPPSRRRPCA